MPPTDNPVEQWPVVWMSRKTGISFLTACHEQANAEAIGDEVTQYYPARHPLVLSPLEAAAVGETLAGRPTPDVEQVAFRVLARLESYDAQQTKESSHAE